MGVPSRTSASTPALDQNYLDLQIILGKVRPFTSPGRGPSTSSDHCSSLTRGVMAESEAKCLWNNDAEPIWLATARYGLRPAPGGLALVQDFLNSRASDLQGPDLLRDAASAEVWTAHAVHAWSVPRPTYSQPPALTDHDTTKLRDLRSVLVDGLGRSPRWASRPILRRLCNPQPPVRRRFRMCRKAKGGSGCNALLGEILLSRNIGSWRRLKLCRNGACQAAFYDRTWNMSGDGITRGSAARQWLDTVPHMSSQPLPGVLWCKRGSQSISVRASTNAVT